MSRKPADEEALRLAVERDRQIESGEVKPLSHEELMARVRRFRDEEKLPVPDAHKKVLDERIQQVKEGRATFSDLESAKARIKRRIAGLRSSPENGHTG